MRVSLGWLTEYVSLDGIDHDEMAHRMSMTGTKVEAIRHPGGEVNGIVVAEVLEIDKHPNADNLSLVEITTGSNEHQRVVCGAKNFKVGDRVPYAGIGAQLPGLEITARKIRGEVSRGMLCSGAELGISKDHSGLLILQPDAPLGADIVSLLGLDDVIFELEITPNRPDCMSVIGVAREVAAIYERELKIPEAGLVADDLDCPVQIEIEDPEGCPRYLARYLEGVQVGPSPAWMVARLLSAGVRPISNIVDATNYVLMETGQPLHAFDAAKISESKIIVRRAAAGERFTTLDGVERIMDERDLMIADPTRALAIAGVMGGLDSEVSDQTTSIILECAAFEHSSIAYTSRRHGLRTEASARFEKGANAEGIPYAAARCARFMTETAGGKVSRREPDAHPGVKDRTRIVLRARRTQDLLGIEIPTERQAQHLSSIGIKTDIREGLIETEIPPFRPDLLREADLIEEVARLEGFDKLGHTVPSGPAGLLTTEQKAVRTLTRTLVAQGMTEAWTSSFLADTDLDALELDEGHPARRLVRVSNPMVEQESALRSALMPGLLRSVARNAAQHARSIGLFEIARIYEPTTGQLAHEELVWSAAMAGHRLLPAWYGPAQPWDLFSAKGALEAGLEALGVSGARYEPISGHAAPFHPTRAAMVLLGQGSVGVIGEVHPDVCDRFEVPEGTVVFEIALAPVFAAMPGRREAAELSRYPSLLIDLAVVVEAGVAAAKVADLVERAGAPEVVSVRLFDLYEGEQIPEGKRSLAFSLEMQDPTRTLTDEDGMKVRDRIVNALAERLGAEIRG